MVYGRRQFGLKKREERAKCHKQSEVAGTREWTISPEEVVPWPRRRAGCVAGGRFAAGRTSLRLRPSPLLQTDQVEGSVATFARVLFTLPHGILDLDLLHARYWVSTGSRRRSVAHWRVQYTLTFSKQIMHTLWTLSRIFSNVLSSLPWSPGEGECVNTGACRETTGGHTHLSTCPAWP